MYMCNVMDTHKKLLVLSYFPLQENHMLLKLRMPYMYTALYSINDQHQTDEGWTGLFDVLLYSGPVETT